MEEELSEAVAVRHTLHQIPELKYQEVKTARLIRRALHRYGYRPQRVGKTGVVALLDSGRPGPTIALRADIDGLPIEEETDVSYRSQHRGVMHACGHDGHTATLLLVARLLKARQKELVGRVKLIFQPAEEGGKGSSSMIEAGVLKDVDGIFGYHNWPGLPLGVIGVRKGAILAGSGRFEVVLQKQVGHLAHTGATSPIALAGKVITELTALGETLNRDKHTLSLISVHGEIAETVKLVGIYHYADDEALLSLQEQVQAGVPPEASLEFRPFHSPTVNSPKEADLVFQCADSPQWLSDCMMVAEDFSEYLKHVPGCFFLIGVGESAPAVHTATFDFDDRILPIATALFCRLLLLQQCGEFSKRGFKGE